MVPPLTQLWYTTLVVLVYKDQGKELPTEREEGDRERERMRAETEGNGECNAETEEAEAEKTELIGNKQNLKVYK